MTLIASQVDANLALGRGFFEEQDRLRGGPPEALCADGYEAVLGSRPTLNRAGHEAFARGFYSAFPDLRHEIEQVIATESRAIVRFVLHGTHTGNLFGIPATGRAVTIPANAILHVDEGHVAKLLAVFDEAGMLRQLGVLPG